MIDQNQIRNASAVLNAVTRCRKEQLQLLIADGAGFEFSKSMSRGADPLQTWKSSLQVIAQHPDQVAVSRKLSVMLKEERAQGAPIGSIVDRGATELFRDLLHHIGSGSYAGLHALVEGSVKKLMPASLPIWADFEGRKQELCKVHDLLKSQLSAQSVKRLRTNPSLAIGEWMSSANGLRFVFQGIRRLGVSDRVAIQLTGGGSVNAAFLSGIAAMGLYWIAFSGLSEAAPESVTNDWHDLEYAILGALSDSLLTVDKRLRLIHRAIQCGLVGRANWFYRALRDGPRTAQG